jgi:hypothetical protein
MALPKLPELGRFCCFETKQGVMYCSIVLAVLWCLSLVSAFWSGGLGVILWNVIWSVVGIAVYGLVVFAIQKEKPRTYLIPALFTSLLNTVLCTISVIVYFITLAWFSAIVLLVVGGLTCYYFLGLYTVYNFMAAPTANVEPA